MTVLEQEESSMNISWKRLGWICIAIGIGGEVISNWIWLLVATGRGPVFNDGYIFPNWTADLLDETGILFWIGLVILIAYEKGNDKGVSPTSK